MLVEPAVRVVLPGAHVMHTGVLAAALPPALKEPRAQMPHEEPP